MMQGLRRIVCSGSRANSNPVMGRNTPQNSVTKTVISDSPEHPRLKLKRRGGWCKGLLVLAVNDWADHLALPHRGESRRRKD